MNNSITTIGKVRQRLGKAYIHTKEESIQSIIIDALVDHGYDVDVEVTNNGTNEVVSCEIYDVGAVRKMIEFIAGLFIGSVAGVAVMSLCAAAKERDNYDKRTKG